MSVGMQSSRPPSRSMTTSMPAAATSAQSSIAGEMNSCPASSTWKSSITRSLADGASAARDLGGRHFAAEIVDRLDEALIELDLRFPAEERPRARDVGTPLL